MGRTSKKTSNLRRWWVIDSCYIEFNLVFLKNNRINTETNLGW